MYQQVALYVSVLLIALLAMAFIRAVKNSSQAGSGEQAAVAAGRWRKRLLLGLSLAFVPIIGYSLTKMPYAGAVVSGGDAMVVQAMGHQWYWDISATELPLGQPVEFHVSSADVNHGFSIYDADMRIVTQTQAMPGVTNVLRHTFDRPGVYKILCLEYCGVSHHNMMTELHVAAK